MAPVKRAQAASEQYTKKTKKVWDATTKAAAWDDSNEEQKYNWEAVHEDVENGNVAGCFGGPNGAFWGLAGLRAGLNMKDWHKKRSPDEKYVESLHSHLEKESTRKNWHKIFTMDPLGMYSGPPTIAATTAHMTIPELEDKLRKDGNVVLPDGSINVTKAAIDFAWNLRKMAKRLKMQEAQMRDALADYAQNDKLLDPNVRTYLPPVGGATVYMFGDITKLSDASTQVAVRVHDACCGSDVFGTDICTCRPYLVFAIQACVECAQRGGVGIVCYYYKEGRSLGEVTKFRVYNARKSQSGGDRPEMYFYHTEAIAGIRDARFQEMMPDPLIWLGISRIDWLLSMSGDKYDAITSAGIKVMQRIELPDEFVPEGATVELHAKIADGYHSNLVEVVDIGPRLRQLAMVRERCTALYNIVKRGEGHHFTLHLDKMPDCVKYVLEVTRETYPDLTTVPYHSRWRHFIKEDLDQMVSQWSEDKIERTRRLVDLVTVSCLLDDAGAGWNWKYITAEGAEKTRSEGLAAASLDMFNAGLFSSDVAVPHRVNSHGLLRLTLQQVAKGFRSTDHNKLRHVRGRHGLLLKLGGALEKRPEFFGTEVCRPGSLVDYVLARVRDGKVSIQVLWTAVTEGFGSIWPDNRLMTVRTGDVWAYAPMKEIGQPGSDLVPFHKLLQWLTYSLLEPFEALGIRFEDLNLLTGLAEYRNGGLFVDTGVLQLRDPDAAKVLHDRGSELLVEWRACTVCLLDILAEDLRKECSLTEEQFPMAKVLQGGTWAAGRKLAGKLRGDHLPTPINISSDGTVFLVS